MYTFRGFLWGAASGLGLGILINIMGGMFEGIGAVYFVCIFFGAIAGLIIGAVVDNRISKQKQDAIERKKADEIKRRKIFEEQERAKREAAELNQWCYLLDNHYKKIEGELLTYNENCDIVKLYTNISVLKKRCNDPKYAQKYSKRQEEHIAFLKDRVCYILTDSDVKGYGALLIAHNLMQSLTYIDNTETNRKAAEYITDLLHEAGKTEDNFLSFSTYGKLIFPEGYEYLGLLQSNVPEKKKAAEEIAQILKERVEKYEKYLFNIKDILSLGDVCECIIKYLELNYVEMSAEVMWYYAKLTPLNQEKFNEAFACYNLYTRLCINEGDGKEFWLDKPEALLARIYVKYQMYGANLDAPEVDRVQQWIKRAARFCPENCWKVASGLAWMDFYDLEKQVLQFMLENSVTLDPELQNRLKFLNEPGNANIKIYDAPDTDTLWIDTNSIDWNEKEYSAFFRKINMRGVVPQYSLARKKWTTLMPLNDQLFDIDSFYAELEKLAASTKSDRIRIHMKRVNAQAINLFNVKYPNAVLFEFEGEQCRCVTTLLYCETYFGNLNLVTYTMFTPDDSLPTDVWESYCQAIRGNMYIENFDEMIKQTVDKMLKPKPSIY